MMQLSPVYGPTPLIELDGDPSAVGEITIRQRRRLASTFADLDAPRWAAPTRCEGWTPRDVASHLESATRFWTLSIRSALADGPTRYLAGFDPVAVPAQIVAADQRPGEEVAAALAAATEELAELLASLAPTDWARLAEGPPGHITIDALVHHGHWDTWTHERDVLLPQGIDPPVEPDEVLAALRYVATLAPALTLGHRGAGRTTVVEVRAADPDATFRVTIDEHVTATSGPAISTPDVVIAGDALDLLEQLSVRRPRTFEVDPAHRWLVDGLAVAFDQPGV